MTTPSDESVHVYTVDVVLHAHEPYPCVICGQWRNAPIHDIDPLPSLPTREVRS